MRDIVLLIISILLFSVSGYNFISANNLKPKEEIQGEIVETETTEEIKEEKSPVLNSSLGKITEENTLASLDDGLDTFPVYYQQDYEYVPLGHHNVATFGNLVTCLSMVESYYTGKQISPDIFVERYGKYINNDGTLQKENCIADMCDKSNISYDTGVFDLSEVANLVQTDEKIVMVRIPHRSIYCNNSTYLLIVGRRDDMVVVRDPDKNNANKAVLSYDNEPCYTPLELSSAIGENSEMYVFDWR